MAIVATPPATTTATSSASDPLVAVGHPHPEVATKKRRDAWENQRKHRCSMCGRTIEILCRHYWPEIPKHHHKCRARTLAARRNRRTDGPLSGAGVARLLKVGDSTLGRWRKSGRLPKPVKVEWVTNRWNPE